MDNLLGLNREGLAAFFRDLGERPFRAEQVMKWIHQHGVDDFARMTNLSLTLRRRLGAGAEVRAPAVERAELSADGTRKWLLRVDSGNCIESVFIPEPERGTLCISSQVGCALGCSFCSTARQGFNRNLSAAEIAGQLWLADRLLAPGAAQTAAAGGRPARRPRTITNVVLMGMGEPLLNLDNVSQAIDLMLDDCAYGLARRRVTLSTAGLVPGIDRLAERAPVCLAVSLHATTDALRDELVPVNRKYPIRTLLEACRRYARVNPKQSITFEYVLLAGVNDSPADARRLVRLLADLPSKVNLIPFNPFPGAPYRRPAPEAIDRFRRVLLDAGLMAITRRPRGDDIDAACGQLAGRVQPRAPRRRAGTGPAAASMPAGGIG